jgi:hypothetical protein
MPIKRSLLAASAAAAVTAVAIPVVTAAQSPAGATSETITFQEDVPRIALDDLAPRAKKGTETISQGDRLITHGGLFDAGRHRLGTISAACTGVGASKPIFAVQLLCTVTYDVTGRGQVVAAGHFSLDGKGTLPVVGGSGDFAGVRGTVTSAAKPEKGFDDADVLSLTR